MDNKTIYRLGELYHWLEDSISPKDSNGEVVRRNTTDFDNACRFPLKMMTIKINMAHKLGVVDQALNRAIANVYADVSLEQMTDEFEKCLSMQQQSEFQRGYWSPNYKGDIACEVTSVTEARKAAGYTMQGLADAIGVSVMTISNIEKGYKTPRSDTLKKIADTCGVTMDEIWRN